MGTLTDVRIPTENPELDLSENALIVLEKRYLKKNEEGLVVETPVEMFRRVASNVALADSFYDEDVEKTEEEFFEVMTNLEFLPNSPTLMNAGKDLQQLSACFVLPIEDSMDSIFEAVKNTALIHKSGGGTGFSFSRLRPKKDIVKSTGGIASGPVSFMKVFDAATEVIKQGGTRRGANMAILRVDHPDIEEFIVCKKNDSSLNNFNISVGITEDFMKAVEENREFFLVNPRDKNITKKVKAKKIFDLIVEMAWKNGEPGIIFLDRINMDNPTPEYEIESTNPCGEQPLLPFESCNLGSINLAKMVENGKINYEKLKKVTRIAVHFLDNVIDMNKYPLEKIEEMTKKNRKIGLGVMGFADMLCQLKIPYNSEIGIELAEKVMKFIRDEARKKSQELAEKRGSFPNFEKSTLKDKYPCMRNATVTTIAPTGSISMIADCSSGIEPLFSVAFIKKVLNNDELLYVNKYFEEALKERNLYSEDLMEKVARSGSLKDLDLPEDLKKIFVTAHEITPEWHVRMQAAFQKYVDNAVSKTVNFPNHASKKDVEEVFILAYKLGCKGVTVYRDGSRQVQVLNKGDEVKKKTKTPRTRPEMTSGGTVKVATGCGNMYVTINEDDKGLCEVFVHIGKSGGCIASHTEAIGRLVSLSLRSGVKIESILKQLRGIRCLNPWILNGEKVYSCADAVGIAIEKYLKNERTSVQLRLDTVYTGACPECPECGGMIEYKEGCYTCRNCGYTKC